MARNCRFQQPFVKGVISLVALFSTLGCESTLTAPNAQFASRAPQLEAEVFRLSVRIAALEKQVQVERQYAARLQQEAAQQRDRIAVLETETATTTPVLAESTPKSSPAAHAFSSEAELRLTMRLLMRTIERLDINADEKAMLKNSLRPTRNIDRDNPWSMAQY